jgi:hypothetical protein
VVRGYLRGDVNLEMMLPEFLQKFFMGEKIITNQRLGMDLIGNFLNFNIMQTNFIYCYK